MKTIIDLSVVLNEDGEDTSWQRQGACRGYSYVADIWYPETLDERERRHVAVAARHAKLICSTCDVSDQCLEYAIAHHESYGIWGGLTPDERKHLWTSRKATS